MSIARAHHFISQCYLRGFTYDGFKKSKLYVVSLRERKAFQSRPEGVAHRRDFNRVEGLEIDAVETMLSGFEGIVATALNRIRVDGSLVNASAWEHVLNLVALFAVRHPVQREKTAKAIDHASRVMLDMLTADPERWGTYVAQAKADGRIPRETDVSYELARDFVKRGDFTIDVPTGKHIELELKVHGPVLETLKQRNWTLCTAEAGAGTFITSDRPAVLTHTDGTFSTARARLGHGLEDTVVIFPINRKLLAFGTFEGAASMRQLDARNVALFNRITLERADREIYGVDGDASVLVEEKLIPLKELPKILLAKMQERRE